MVHNLMYSMTEISEWLCSEQAGFRKLLSQEDQILRISQTISDGFLAAKLQRSLMALLGFSKVFGRVWREEPQRTLQFSLVECLSPKLYDYSQANR